MAFGLACSVGELSLLGYVHALGTEEDLYPAGIVASVFVPTGFATLHEISRYFRTTNERLAEAERNARDALEARSRFLAKMSHELRTPLNAILGYSELLMDDAGEDLQDLDRIHRSGRLLLGHIDAPLDLSKLEAGQTTTWVEPVDLEALLAEVAAEQALAIAERQNALKLEVEPGVLANKFTSAGTLTVRASPEANGYRFEVSDTGVGMTPEELDRVFEAFVQADARTTREYGGTGLGLTIVKELVRLLEGTISPRSAPGVGTTFRITLPDLSDRLQAQRTRRVS